jgi:two-component system sensor histidine kinase KdpD
MPDQVLVCLSSRGPNSDRLLRYASRFAGRLNKNWYALYVQTPAEDPLQIDGRTQDALAYTLTLAKQLGAIVFTFKGEDLPGTILRFAREYHVGHIIIGAPHRLSFLQKLRLRRTLSERLVLAARGINIVVVDTHPRAPEADPLRADAPPERGPAKTGLSGLLAASRVRIWDGAALKEEVLRELSYAACGAEAEGLDIFNRLLQREKEGSTFFNEGVAFPHLRLEQDTEPRIALGILPAGVADVPTAVPIRLVFLIVTRLQEVDLQARLLAAASRIAANKHLVDILMRSKSPAEALDELARWENREAIASG